MKFHLNPAMLHVVTKMEESVPETDAVLATKPPNIYYLPLHRRGCQPLIWASPLGIKHRENQTSIHLILKDTD